MLRLAGSALRALYPALRQGSLRSAATWGKAAPDIAMDLVPNALFAGMAGAALPGADPATGFEGATMGDRIGASLFDAAISTPIGMGGRLAGAGVARGLRRMRGGRSISPEWEMGIQGVTGMGAELGLWGSGLLSNPAANSVFERYNAAYARAEEENQRALREQIVAEERERMMREQRALDYGGLGAALSPFGFGGFG